MKSSLIILLSICVFASCKNAKNKAQESESEDNTLVDTIITGNEELENTYGEDATESASSLDEIYLPKIDSLIALYDDMENNGAWDKRENFQNIEFEESTEGNELIYYKSGIYQKYQLNTFGEMGKAEESFYLIKNELILYSHTDIRYNAPINADSTTQDLGGEIFDETKTEQTIEDSYFKRGKIVFQGCQDCGDPYAKEYIRSIEDDVETKLAAFKKLVK